MRCIAATLMCMRVCPINHADPADLLFVREELVRHWHDVGIWSLGRRYQADELPGFIAIDDRGQSTGESPPRPVQPRLGLVTYCLHDGGYSGEVITLSSRRENLGVATALLEAAVQAIRSAGCVRAFLTTTNDNLRALGFYQKRGWKLAALHKGLVEEARKRKPIIPEMGMNGIVVRDEIELEMWLIAGDDAADQA
jgi:ribosomal protein S18 acetylase RimI-like enzyme